MLPQEGRRTPDAGRGLREFEGRVGHPQLGHRGMGHCRDHLAGQHLGIIDHVRHPIDGTAGDASLGDQVHPCGHGLGAENLTEGGHALGAVGHPVVVRLEARVRHEVGSPDSLAEAFP